MSTHETLVGNQLLESMLVNSYFNKLVGIASLSINIGPRDPPLSSIQSDVINRQWNDVLRRNPNAYSTDFLAINGFQMDAHTGTLSLDTYVSSYRDWSGTRSMPSQYDRIWCLGTCGLSYIVSGDQRVFIFGERTSTTLNVGGAYESLPGGFTDSPKVGETECPVISSLFNELFEEIGVGRQHVAGVHPFSFGMLREWNGSLYQDTCINSLLHLTLDEESLRAAFESQNETKRQNGKHIEHARVIFVPENEMLPFLEKYNSRMGVRTLFTLESYVQTNRLLSRING